MVIITLWKIFLECVGLLGMAFGFALLGIIAGYCGLIALLKLEEEVNKTEAAQHFKEWYNDNLEEP